EQFTGAPVDARSDIFSLGAVLYWLCTSQRPFPGDTLTAIAYNVVNNPPSSPRSANPAVPDALERVILRCLEKDAGARYPDMQTLAADLTAIKASSLGELTLPLKA